MIILLAMTNSLAARANSLQGPTGPPDRAARGVFAGDWKIGKSGDRRRRIKGLFRRDRVVKRPCRPTGGPKVVDLPSGHRQPENEARLGAPPFKRRRPGADVTIPIRACCRPWSDRSIPGFRLQSPRTDARRGIEDGKRSDGSTTRPGAFAQPAGHPLMVPARASLNKKQAGRANSVRIRNAP